MEIERESYLKPKQARDARLLYLFFIFFYKSFHVKHHYAI